MTDATKLIAGLLLIAVTTIEFGGTRSLSQIAIHHLERVEGSRQNLLHNDHN